MNNPRISVIMGIYNCADTLRESVDSLYAQTYSDFELIMCDDGSVDATYQVALSLKEQYPNIILLKNEQNKGLNHTLNRCLKMARGKYVARQDGDDVSLPQRFEKEVAVLDSNKEIGIVSSSMIYFDESGDFRIGMSVEYPTKYDFVRGSPFCHAPCMIRKDVLLSVGGYSEGEHLLRVEDYHLWFKMYAQGVKGYNIQKPLYKMRDGRDAYKRRTFKNRLNEAYVKYIGFKMLHLPFLYYVYILRPIIVGLLPEKVYLYLHRSR